VATNMLLDLGLSVLTLLFLVRGLLRGLVREIAGLFGIFLGMFLAGKFYPLLQPQFSAIIASPRWADGLSYAAIFALTQIAVAICVAIILRFLAMTFMTWLDSLGGAAVGFMKGVFVCAVVVALMRRFVPDEPVLTEAILPGYIDPVIALARSLLPAFLDVAGKF